MSELNIWWHNKKINPYTKRKIKKNGKVFNKLLKECLRDKHIIDNYDSFRSNKKDPLTHMNLPLIKGKPLFEYKHCWNPLSGEIIGKDPRGSLYFDPDTLIHYFYTNRLRYLWNEGDFQYSGNYGDGLGNGPDFHIPGRGYSLHYYLFRLPINDAFCDNLSKQQTTIGPKLDFQDIIKLYELSSYYGDNYHKLFGTQRPNIIEIYELYHEAIKKNTVDINLQNELFLSREDIENNKFMSNKLAVDKLKVI